MADYDSLAATGRSIVRLLTHCFAEGDPIFLGDPPSAVLIRTEDLKIGHPNNESVLEPPAVSIFFYRVDFNRATRPGWSAATQYTGRAHLPLDLHFLLTPWANNAEYELRLLGRAMQCLDANPILTGPILDPNGSWEPGDAIQISLAELTTEEVMRTFDSLPVDFKLSVPYLARVIRLDSRVAQLQPETGQSFIRADGDVAPPDPPLAPVEVEESA